MNKGGRKALLEGGFTVVETMIVLAVTSVLFVSTSLMISGKQRRTEFYVGSKQIQQKFEQVINETSSGYFPNNSGYRCSISGSGNINISAGGTQGTNEGCIFAGKTIVSGATGTFNPRLMKIYALAGKRTTSTNGPDVKTPQEARPTAIVTGGGPGDDVNVEQYSVPNSLEFRWLRLTSALGGTTTETNGARLAILSSFATFNTVGADSGGSQSFSLYRFSNSAPPSNQTDSAAASSIVNENAVGSSWQLLNKAEYCFASGGTDQSVLVTIGSNSGGTGVSSDIRTGTSCL